MAKHIAEKLQKLFCKKETLKIHQFTHSVFKCKPKYITSADANLHCIFNSFLNRFPYSVTSLILRYTDSNNIENK